MGTGTAIIVVVGLVVFAYMFGIGTDFINGIVEGIAEQQERQKDQSSGSVQETGNFAKDRGTRVCDLRIEFVGSMTDLNPASIDIINAGNERFLWLGDVRNIANIYAPNNKNILEYKWLCTSSATTAELLQWNLENNLHEASLLILGIDKTDGEVVRIKFEGLSKETDKFLFDKTGKTQFQSSVTLPIGSDFPYEFRTKYALLKGVTEDDYNLRWWSEDYKVNNEAVGHKFTYNLCMPSKKTC